MDYMLSSFNGFGESSTESNAIVLAKYLQTTKLLKHLDLS